MYTPVVDPRLPRFGSIEKELTSLNGNMTNTTPVETGPNQPKYDMRHDGTTMLNTDEPQSMKLCNEKEAADFRRRNGIDASRVSVRSQFPAPKVKRPPLPPN